MQDCDIKYKEAYISERILWQYVIDRDSNVDRDDLDNSAALFFANITVFSISCYFFCVNCTLNSCFHSASLSFVCIAVMYFP